MRRLRQSSCKPYETPARCQTTNNLCTNAMPAKCRMLVHLSRAHVLVHGTISSLILPILGSGPKSQIQLEKSACFV